MREFSAKGSYTNDGIVEKPAGGERGDQETMWTWFSRGFLEKEMVYGKWGGEASIPLDVGGNRTERLRVKQKTHRMACHGKVL